MNLFPFCFEPQPEIAGVPFIGDDAIQQMYWPHPRHPDKWNDERMLQNTSLRPHVLDSERDAALALIRSGTDVVPPTVVFDASLSGGVLCWREARTFLERYGLFNIWSIGPASSEMRICDRDQASVSTSAAGMVATSGRMRLIGTHSPMQLIGAGPQST
jgi:hypothetical protein